MSREWAISVVGEKGCVGGWVYGGEVRKCIYICAVDGEEEGRNRQARERKQRTRGVPLLQENEVMKVNRWLASSSSADEAVVKRNRRSRGNYRDDKDGKLHSSPTKTHTKPE